MTAKYWNGFFLELLVTKVKDTQVDRSFWACLQEKNDWVKIKKKLHDFERRMFSITVRSFPPF